MMTAEQLKNSILQIALSGKLVSQDRADESAQILLKRIREKKRTLIKAKLVPKDRNMEDVSEDEQLFDIPDNWVWTRIGELFQHNTGKALNGANKDGTVLSYITTSNLYWNRFELDNLKEMPFTDEEIEKCTATKGDLLVCEGGDYGRAAIWNYDFDIRIQNHVHKLRAYEKLCTEYFYYVFNFMKSTGQIKGKGIAIQGLSSGALHNLVVPLPPLNEQYRIVEKIKEIIPVWKQYAAASTKLNTLNTTFPDMMKKSILQEAVQGKLVPQDPNDEPASVLLKKITEEKKRLIKEGKIKKQKPLPEITEGEIPFDIPESWEWVRLGELITYQNGYPYKSSDMTDHGFPVIKSGNLMTLQVVIKPNNDFIFNPTEKMLESKIVKGDMLMCLSSQSNNPEPLGKTAVYLFEEPALLNQRVLKMRPIDNRLTRYLYYAINSEYFHYTVSHQGGGSAQANLKMEHVLNMLIPIPPIKEQERIVNKIQRLIPCFITLRNKI